MEATRKNRSHWTTSFIAREGSTWEYRGDRLRAILLTTLTTTAGMLPLAYGLGGQDLYMASMALVLGYGLLFATPLTTPLTLLLLPCLYLMG